MSLLVAGGWRRVHVQGERVVQAESDGVNDAAARAKQ